MRNQATIPEKKIEAPEGPGILLKAVRLERGLSLEDVAQSLKLTQEIILILESDSFDKKIATTFYKGYIKSYAKLLKISEVEVLDRYEKYRPKEKPHAVITSTFETRISQELKERKLSAVHFLIIFILVISLVFIVGYWVSNHLKSTPNETPEDKPLSLIHENISENEIPLSLDNNQTILTSEGNNEAVSDKNSSILKPSGTTSDQSNQNENPSPEISESIQQTNERPVQSSFASLESMNMHIEFKGDCWVKITDKNDNILAIGIKRTGKIIALTGDGPFKLVIGKPSVVSIQLNETPVDLSIYPKGHAATFTLPFED
ncbi:MAG: hypothetical protein COW84_01920 [Gammaproteobacteria bacterium CG22_combo_CG10-13_8_21_14_all_40_8]|nr:MAG: hypothetical protein COW84_01920 [Gammaproteobacteria bacterium CG22_combo_CG10-13_8_21_14_all_40_8]